MGHEADTDFSAYRRQHYLIRPVCVLVIDSRGHAACADSLEVTACGNITLLTFTAGSDDSSCDAEKPNG